DGAAHPGRTVQVFGGIPEVDRPPHLLVRVGEPRLQAHAVELGIGVDRVVAEVVAEAFDGLVRFAEIPGDDREMHGAVPHGKGCGQGLISAGVSCRSRYPRSRGTRYRRGMPSTLRRSCPKVMGRVPGMMTLTQERPPARCSGAVWSTTMTSRPVSR